MALRLVAVCKSLFPPLSCEGGGDYSGGEDVDEEFDDVQVSKLRIFLLCGCKMTQVCTCDMECCSLSYFANLSSFANLSCVQIWSVVICPASAVKVP